MATWNWCLRRGVCPDRGEMFRRCLHHGLYRLRWRRLDVSIRRQRTSRYRHCGPSLIHARELCAVGSRLPLCLHLRSHRGHVRRMRGRDFSDGGPRPNSVPSNVAHPASSRVVYHGSVVHVRDIGRVDVVDRTVITEAVILPISALVAAAGVTVAVVHVAIVADISSPVAVVVSITAPIEAPISRSPQCAGVRRQRPRSRCPVIAVGRICPVARRPNVSIARAGRLIVLRQWGWRFFCVLNRLNLVVLVIAFVIVLIVWILIVVVTRRITIGLISAIIGTQTMAACLCSGRGSGGLLRACLGHGVWIDRLVTVTHGRQIRRSRIVLINGLRCVTGVLHGGLVRITLTPCD